MRLSCKLMSEQSRVQVDIINNCLILRFEDSYCPCNEGVFKRQPPAISRLMDNNMDEWASHRRLTFATSASGLWICLYGDLELLRPAGAELRHCDAWGVGSIGLHEWGVKLTHRRVSNPNSRPNESGILTTENGCFVLAVTCTRGFERIKLDCHNVTFKNGIHKCHEKITVKLSL